MEHDTRKFRGARRPGQPGAPARPAKQGRVADDQASYSIENEAAALLATVISRILPRHDPQHPPADSDLFVDSRKFLMIIRHLETELGFEIDDEALLGVDLITYGDLVRFVGSIFPGEGR